MTQATMHETMTVVLAAENVAWQVAQRGSDREPFAALSLVGDLGPVTAGRLARELGILETYAQAWLRWQADQGYLHRDEFGRYATFCAIPRTY